MSLPTIGRDIQLEIVVDVWSTHSQKDGVEGNGGSLKGGAEAVPACAALSWFCGLVSSQYLTSMNVTLKNAEIFGSMLSGEGGIGTF